LLGGEMLGEELPILLCLRTHPLFPPFHLLTNFVSVFDSLVAHRLTPHIAWRVSFVTVPFVIVMTMAISILAFAPDTPTGPWKDRHLNRILEGVECPSIPGKVVDVAKYDVEDGTPSVYVSTLKSDDVEKEKPSEKVEP